MPRSNRTAGGYARRPTSFTLVEMLVVMAIISILASLALYAGFTVYNMGARKRAQAEIQAMSAAQEGYKVDNGIYVQGDGNLLTNGGTPYTAADGTVTGDEYQTNATLLYVALSGQTNFLTPPAVGTKTYMQFKVNQVGNNATTTGYSYVRDPWQHAYGYSTGTPIGALTTNYPYNGNGFFDLWSTAGVTTTQVGANASLTNAWIENWQ